MKISTHRKLGFFFTVVNSAESRLYFAGFRQKISHTFGHEIIIVEVEEARQKDRHVTYVVDPGEIPRLDNEIREILCRIAVSQFLAKLATGNFPSCAQRLELACEPWDGLICTI